MQIRPLFIHCLLALLILISGCSTTRHLEEGQYLLDKNTVIIEGPATHISKDDLSSLIRQKPNRRLLGIFRFGNYIYFKTTQGKETGFKRWLQRSMAREPVLYDSTLSASSLRQMDLFAQNKGSFANKATYDVKYGKHNARVRYRLQTNEPYKISHIRDSISDPALAWFSQRYASGRLIQPGDFFDVDALDKERDRFVRELKEHGYYSYIKEYISFYIDSTLGGNRMDLTMHIAPPLTTDTGGASTDHPRHRIRRVYVYPDYNPLTQGDRNPDTVIIAEKRWSFDKPAGLFYFIHNTRPRIHPDALIQGIYIEPGMYYKLSSVQRTFRRLSDLPVYRFVNIQFREVAGLPGAIERELDAEIRMTRAPVQSYNIETEGTNSAGDLGIAGSIVYTNRNLFRRAEVLDLRLKGALEMQQTPGGEKGDFLVFNTYETGAEVGFRVPRFLAPVSSRQLPKVFEPSTRLDLGINLRQRPQYRRLVTNVSFGYEWKESETRRHILYPADINAIRVLADSSFNPGIYGPLYEAQYSDHLITALKYSFIFNNQQIRKGMDFMYFRGNFSASGNMLSFIEDLVDSEGNGEGYRRLLGIRYAQYLRTDVDLRYYQVLNPQHNLVYRFVAGLGLPYGNSEVLPFEQAFFSGGSNGLRGWEVRSLGPGGFVDLAGTRYDKIGDLLLEANMEYRFPVYRYLKAALFLDAGNVWLLRPNDAFPDGHFLFTRFASQLAVDGGLGIRLDFGFVILRLDAALPLRHPDLPSGERWIRIEKFQPGDIMLQFGIGHPF